MGTILFSEPLNCYEVRKDDDDYDDNDDDDNNNNNILCFESTHLIYNAPVYYTVV